MKLKKQNVSIVLLLPTLVIILFPLLYMMLFSFSENRFPGFPVDSFSFFWYEQVFKNTLLTKSILLTAFISISVSAISVLLGFMSGYSLARSTSVNKDFNFFLLMLPSAIPYILYAVGLLQFSRYIYIQRTHIAIIIGHVVVLSPIATAYFYRCIRHLNPDIESAARELGASEFSVLSNVVAGQLYKNIGACALLIFVLSWDEYIISWFVSGFDKTYPVHVRNMLESTFSPVIFAIGTIIGLFCFALLTLAVSWSTREFQFKKLWKA
jgi:spermidine/putrescine transport system permease protein